MAAAASTSAALAPPTVFSPGRGYHPNAGYRYPPAPAPTQAQVRAQPLPPHRSQMQRPPAGSPSAYTRPAATVAALHPPPPPGSYVVYPHPHQHHALRPVSHHHLHTYPAYHPPLPPSMPYQRFHDPTGKVVNYKPEPAAAPTAGPAKTKDAGAGGAATATLSNPIQDKTKDASGTPSEVVPLIQAQAQAKAPEVAKKSSTSSSPKPKCSSVAVVANPPSAQAPRPAYHHGHHGYPPYHHRPAAAPLYAPVRAHGYSVAPPPCHVVAPPPSRATAVVVPPAGLPPTPPAPFYLHSPTGSFPNYSPSGAHAQADAAHKASDRAVAAPFSRAMKTSPNVSTHQVLHPPNSPVSSINTEERMMNSPSAKKMGTSPKASSDAPLLHRPLPPTTTTKTKRGRPWTAEEDALIAEHYERLGNKWVEISKFFVGRSGNAIKNRWKLSSKKEDRFEEVVEGGDGNHDGCASDNSGNKGDHGKRKSNPSTAGCNPVKRSRVDAVLAATVAGHGSHCGTIAMQANSDDTVAAEALTALFFSHGSVVSSSSSVVSAETKFASPSPKDCHAGSQGRPCIPRLHLSEPGEDCHERPLPFVSPVSQSSPSPMPQQDAPLEEANTTRNERNESRALSDADLLINFNRSSPSPSTTTATPTGQQ